MPIVYHDRAVDRSNDTVEFSKASLEGLKRINREIDESDCYGSISEDDYVNKIKEALKQIGVDIE